jgi:hypothetical protein
MYITLHFYSAFDHRAFYYANLINIRWKRCGKLSRDLREVLGDHGAGFEDLD